MYDLGTPGKEAGLKKVAEMNDLLGNASHQGVYGMPVNSHPCRIYGGLWDACW